MVQVAVNIMLGQTLAQQGYVTGLWPTRGLVAVKAPVFSMSKLIGVDTYLGPEMKSTGEVMGIDADFPAALAKALMSADLALKPGAGVLLSIADRHKTQMLPVIRKLHDSGCRLYATEGTAGFIAALGLPVEQVTKRLNEGHPNVVDVISDGSVSCVINTPEGRYTGTLRDGFYIRRAATEKRIPCFTSADTARAAVDALAASTAFGGTPGGARAYQVRPLPEYRDGARA
jgi:carbamoyl-phosphate synthase large subunit